jgi:hypothetical protein
MKQQVPFFRLLFVIIRQWQRQHEPQFVFLLNTAKPGLDGGRQLR